MELRCCFMSVELELALDKPEGNQNFIFSSPDERDRSLSLADLFRTSPHAPTSTV
eukprot:CAMPEP_0169092148 /NCGR_PEP_ID=MMETSP1015-20121227/16750_1 /TAXON_ID=342587 /ORGANISM="Karlodinium micrum, Strain CCMP2283" /LENGTH=54 /DNA_ID=CAMNT_0009152705 /DNA_START=195 /DNA_END=359 /DNA_ORIENTATION=-